MRNLPLLLAMMPVYGLAQASPALPAPVDIVTQEQHLWTSFAEGDFNTVRGLFADDYVQVSDTIQALDTTLVFLHHCTLTSYELRDLQVRILSADSAMTAYHVVSSFTCSNGTKTVKSEVKNFDNNSLTVWVRPQGSTKWLVQAHTETPVMKAH
jgi:hypothetical protein